MVTETREIKTWDYLRRSIHNTVWRYCQKVLEFLQQTRWDRQIGDTQDLWVVGDYFTQASRKAQIVCDDHGRIQRLKIQNHHWTGVKSRLRFHHEWQAFHCWLGSNLQSKCYTTNIEHCPLSPTWINRKFYTETLITILSTSFKVTYNHGSLDWILISKNSSRNSRIPVAYLETEEWNF